VSLHVSYHLSASLYADNSASIGTILGYVFYWLFLIGVLLYLKWQEGRLSFRGKGSAAYNRRMDKRAVSGEPSGTDSNSDEGESPSEEKKDKDLVPQ
jgi:high-affinity iron transporter